MIFMDLFYFSNLMLWLVQVQPDPSCGHAGSSTHRFRGGSRCCGHGWVIDAIRSMLHQDIFVELEFGADLALDAAGASGSRLDSMAPAFRKDHSLISTHSSGVLFVARCVNVASALDVSHL
jgi:hypothetical protein